MSADNFNKVFKSLTGGSSNQEDKTSSSLPPGAVPLTLEEEAMSAKGDYSYLAKPLEPFDPHKEEEQSILESVNDSLSKKFFSTPDSKLVEAHKINQKIGIPVNAILANDENFKKAREMEQRYKALHYDKNALQKEYPKLKEFLNSNPVHAAMALKDIENVKRTHGIIEAAVTSWQAGQDSLRKARLGWKGMSGQRLSKKEQQELAQIKTREKKQKSLPGFMEDPLSAMVGGVAQNLPMMFASSLEGLKMGAGTGMATGGAAALASSPSLVIPGAGEIFAGLTTTGATALGFGTGFQAGVGKDLVEQMSGLQYYSLSSLKDKNGNPLLTKNEAKVLAALSGVIEAGVEVSNLDKVLTFIKPAERALIKKIIKEATIDGRFSKDAAKLAMKRYIGQTAKGAFMVTGTETLEEVVQGTSEITTEEIAKSLGASKGKPVEYRTGKQWAEDIAESGIEALPTTLGFGILSGMPRIAKSPSVYREFTREISEQQKKLIETQSGVNAISQLKEVQLSSKMAKETPDVFANMVASQVEDTPFAEVRIDVQSLAQDQGLEAVRNLAINLGKTEEVSNALELGIDVVIPMEEYAQSILPNPVASQIENYIKFSEDGTVLARVKERAEELTEKYNKIVEGDNLKGQQFADNFIDTYFEDEISKSLAQEIMQRNPADPHQGYNEISRELQKEMKQIIKEKAKELDNGQYTKEQLEVAAIAELAENEDFTAKQEKLQALQQIQSVLEDLPSEQVSSLKGLSPEGLQVYRTTKERIKNSGVNKDVLKASHAGALFIARHAERYAEAMRASGRPFTAEDYLNMRRLNVVDGGQADIQGSIGFMQTGEVIIKIFEKANRSTFLHESGHLFVRDLKDLAEIENAPEQIKKDWETVKEFLGWQEEQDKFTVEQQEKWATAFEAYLMDGKAPATSLQRIFRQLKTWLTKIYKDFIALGGKPPKEVRQVMDRMIASEEEIENSIILNDYKAFEKSGGTAVLSGSTQEMYLRMSQDSEEEAKEKMLAKLMRDISKEHKAVIDEKVAEEEKRIREEVGNNPIFKTKEILDSEDMQGASLEEKEALLNTLGYFSYDEYLNELAKEGITELDPTEKQFVNMLQDKPIEEIEKTLKARLDQVYQTELDYLKNSGGQGVEQGSLLRDETTGEVINRVGRISKNPQWYRDFFKNHGRKPTQSELKELAQKRLSEGYEDEEVGFVEPNEEYINLVNTLERIEVIKGKLDEINKMPAGNLIENVIARRVEVYRNSLENEFLDPEKLKEEAEKQIRGPLRLQVLAMELAILSKKMLMAGMVETPTTKKAQGEKVQKIKDKMQKEIDKLNEKIKDLKYSARWNEAEQKLIFEMKDSRDKAAKKEEINQINELMKSIKSEQTSNLRVLREEAIASARAARQSAMFALEKLPLKESANTKLWINKERQAAIKADKAMATKKWEEAVYWKERQMLFSAMAKYSFDLSSDAQKWLKNINKKQKSKAKMPIGDRYQMDKLLYKFGFTNEEPDLTPFPEDNIPLIKWVDRKLEDYESEQIAEWIIFGEQGGQYGIDYTLSPIANLTEGETKVIQVKGWKGLTYEQLKDVNDAITTIYTIGRNEGKLMSVNGVSLDEVVDELVDSIVSNFPKRKDVINPEKKTTFQKLITDVPDTLNSWLLKAETIIHELDGFKDDGPAMQWIYNIINDARNEELKVEPEAAATMTSIFKAYSNKELAEMRNKKIIQVPGTETNLTKEQVLMIALNWGNEQNRQRLMDGYGWNPDQIQTVLEELNPKDWDVVQGIWDWINSYWEDIAKLEAEFTGVVPQKVEPSPFNIIDAEGNEQELKGGYFPIRYDSQKSVRASQHEEDNNILMKANGSANAATRRGHTKKRAEKVKRPILLDFVVISDHVNNVIHDLTHRKAVRDVNRILNNQDVQEAMISTIGMDKYRWLKQWLKMVASSEQQYLTPGERIMKGARTGMTIASMGFKLTIAILNILNLFPAMDYMGAHRVMRGITSFYSSPQEHWEFVSGKSQFMAQRFKTMDRDLRDAMKRTINSSSIPVWDKIKDYQFWLVGVTDSMVSLPLWLEEYKTKLAQYSKEGNLTPDKSEKKAIDAADAVVRRLIGSGDVKDLAMAQQVNEYTKALTMFYSYFSVLHNMLYRRYKETFINYNPGIMFQSLLFWIVVPAVTEAAFRTWLQQSGDDEWDAEEFFKKALANMASYATGTVPIIRDVAAGIIDVVSGRRGSYRMSPLEDAFQRIIDVANKAGSEDADWVDIGRAIGKAVDPWMKIPDQLTGSVWNIADWWQDEFDGEMSDFMKDLLFNRKKKD